MALLGKVKFISPLKVRGWCFEEKSHAAIKAHLYINGKSFQSQTADIPRPSLKKRKIHNTGKCGYLFKIDESLIQDNEVELKVFFGKNKLNIIDNFKYINSTNHKKKIFFLHIPKAGGTSLNEMLALNFQQSKTKFHIEGDRENKYRNINVTELDFLSGHIRLHEIIKHLTLNDFLRITILRDPFNQLCSHINWLKFISEDPKGSFFRGHPQPIQEISLKIREINFSNTSEIVSFFYKLSPLGNQLFNNCQTRYLLNTTAPHILDNKHAALAIMTLHFFDIIGTVEHYDSFLQKISDTLGWETKIELIQSNALNNKYGIEKESQRLKEILYPLITADQILYNHVVTYRS